MTVYYWKNKAGSETLLSDHADAIECILNRRYSPFQLEKLTHGSSTPIYSYRLNNSDRLLFTTHNQCLHVLEHVENHDYQKSRFLKKGVLRRYLLTQEQVFSPVDVTDELPVFSSTMEDTHIAIGLDYYNNQFVSLSDEQTKAMGNVKLPLVLVGAAGTGKSYVSLSMLLQKYNECEDGGRILYLTKETRLVQQMQSNWSNGFSSDVNEGVVVDFKSYFDLCALSAPGKHAVDSQQVERWFAMAKASGSTGLSRADEYYREFRICSGFSKEAYCDLGVRQSLVEKTARAALYDSYLSYLRSMAETEYDPDFFALGGIELYDFVVVDEAQNLSTLQHAQLVRLAKHNAIVYCIDPHQDLTGVVPIRVLLECQLQELGVTTLHLKQTRRYSRHVGRALEQLLGFGRQILGGKLDKEEALTMPVDENAQPGELHVMSPDEVSGLEWIKDRATGVHLAVVTTVAFLDEARTLFDTELVFTIEQIQGQEFHTVIAYKLLADEVSQDYLKQITAQIKLESNPSLTNRSKKNSKKNADYAPWIHSLFTAYSRAMHTLLIVDKCTHGNEIYMNVFQNKLATQNVKPAPVKSTLVSDWEAMAKIQEAHGNVDMARKIQRKIGMKPVERRENKDVAPEPNIVLSKPKKVGKIVSSAKTPSEVVVFDKSLGERLKKAAINNNLKEVEKLLLIKNLDVNQKFEMGFTVLMYAITQGNLDLVHTLLKDDLRLNINARSSSGATALMIAAQSGNLLIVQALLNKKGLDIHATFHKNENITALRFAAERGYLSIVRELIKPRESLHVGSVVKKADDKALMVAAQNGHTAVVRELLKYKRFNINVAKDDGVTSLILAIINGHRDVVRELLTYDELDINAVEDDGYTGLMFAVEKNHTEIMYQLLKDKRTLVNKVNNLGYSALIIAIQYGNLVAVKALLDFNEGERLDINALTAEGTTPLLYASLKGHLDMVFELLKQGIRLEPNKLNHLGETALIHLLRQKSGKSDILNALLSDARVLEDTVKRIVRQPYLLAENPNLFLSLFLHHRHSVGSLIKDRILLGLSPDEHRDVLQAILDLSLSKERYSLYQLLFKLNSGAASRVGLFASTNTEQEMTPMILEDMIRSYDSFSAGTQEVSFYTSSRG